MLFFYHFYVSIRGFTLSLCVKMASNGRQMHVTRASFTLGADGGLRFVIGRRPPDEAISSQKSLRVPGHPHRRPQRSTVRPGRRSVAARPSRTRARSQHPHGQQPSLRRRVGVPLLRAQHAPQLLRRRLPATQGLNAQSFASEGLVPIVPKTQSQRGEDTPHRVFEPVWWCTM